MIDIVLVMTFSGPGVTPVGDCVTGPVIRGQEQFTPLGGKGPSRRPADIPDRLAVPLPRVGEDVLEREDLDRVGQAPPWGELFRRRVLGHVLVDPLPREPAVLAPVLVDLVEEHRGSGGVLRPSARTLVHGLHDVLENEEEKGVAGGRSHPRVRDRVGFARVHAHPAEEGLSTVLLKVVRRHRSRFRVGNRRDIVRLEQVVRRSKAFDVKICIDTGVRRQFLF